MKCSGSPTICIAPERHEAATQFEAMLFRIALAPVGKALGFFGDVAVDATALALARSEPRLASTFERSLR